MKKKTVSYWKKRAWKQFSLYIRERDNYTCITCGKSGKGSFMHAGHYIPGRYNATRFNEKNVHAQCMNCNVWGYGNTGTYTLEMQKRYGPGIIEELTAESKKVKQFTIKELQELEEKYKNLALALQENK